MSYSEVHRLPIRYRRWFLSRLAKHFSDQNERWEEATSKTKTQSPQPNIKEKLSQFESQVKSKF